MSHYPHIAKGRWPQPMPQTDWVDTLIVMEHWLNTNIGPERWSWALDYQTNPSEACVAFALEKHRTLFLLQWA